jgi:hypothetical protein
MLDLDIFSFLFGHPGLRVERSIVRSLPEKVIIMEKRVQIYALCLELRRAPDLHTQAQLMHTLISELTGAPLSVLRDFSMLINVLDVLNCLQFEETQPIAVAFLGVIGLANCRVCQSYPLYIIGHTGEFAFDVIVNYLFHRVPCDYEPATQQPLLLSALALLIRHGVPTQLSEHIFSEPFWNSFSDLLFFGIHNSARLLYLIVKNETSTKALKPHKRTLLACAAQQLNQAEEPGDSILFWWKILNIIAKDALDCQFATNQLLRLFGVDRSRLLTAIFLEILKFMKIKPIQLNCLVSIVPLLADANTRVAILTDELFLRLSVDEMIQFIAQVREVRQFETFVGNIADQICSKPPACIAFGITLLGRVIELEDIWNESILEACKHAAEIVESRNQALQILMIVDDRMIKRGEEGIRGILEEDEEFTEMLNTQESGEER